MGGDLLVGGDLTFSWFTTDLISFLNESFFFSFSKEINLLFNSVISCFNLKFLKIITKFNFKIPPFLKFRPLQRYLDIRS